MPASLNNFMAVSCFPVFCLLCVPPVPLPCSDYLRPVHLCSNCLCILPTPLSCSDSRYPPGCALPASVSCLFRCSYFLCPAHLCPACLCVLPVPLVLTVCILPSCALPASMSCLFACSGCLYPARLCRASPESCLLRHLVLNFCILLVAPCPDPASGLFRCLALTVSCRPVPRLPLCPACYDALFSLYPGRL
jgi:hypothetical protein